MFNKKDFLDDFVLPVVLFFSMVAIAYLFFWIGAHKYHEGLIECVDVFDSIKCQFIDGVE